MTEASITGGTCLVFAAGDYYPEPTALPSYDCLLAADGGADQAQQAGLDPNFTVGDFDSISRKPTSDSTHIVLPAEKDDTDMVACLKLAWGKGYHQFHIYGGLGGRIDHSIANVATLCMLAQAGGIGFLHGQGTMVTAFSNGSLSFPSWKPKGNRMISVFSATDTSEGVNVLGLKYELKHAQMDMTMSRGSGISNEFLDGQPSVISVDAGTLLLTYPIETPQPRWESRLSPQRSLGDVTTETSCHLKVHTAKP